MLDGWDDEEARYFFKAKFKGGDEWEELQLGETGFGGKECTSVVVRIDYSGELIFGESNCTPENYGN